MVSVGVTHGDTDTWARLGWTGFSMFTKTLQFITQIPSFGNETPSIAESMYQKYGWIPRMAQE